MFTKKEPTLLESIKLTINESKQIKSVFSEMKTNLLEKNEQLKAKSIEIDELVSTLQSASIDLSEESASNVSAIENIDKILGVKIKKK